MRCTKQDCSNRYRSIICHVSIKRKKTWDLALPVGCSHLYQVLNVIRCLMGKWIMMIFIIRIWGATVMCRFLRIKSISPLILSMNIFQKWSKLIMKKIKFFNPLCTSRITIVKNNPCRCSCYMLCTGKYTSVLIALIVVAFIEGCEKMKWKEGRRTCTWKLLKRFLSYCEDLLSTSFF